jgi:hypothetical protein
MWRGKTIKGVQTTNSEHHCYRTLEEGVISDSVLILALE